MTRRWLPWRRRRLRLRGESVVNVGGDDPIGLAVGLLIGLFLPVILMVAFGAIEFLLLVALLPFAVAARIAFGKHWVIEARRDWTPYFEAPAGSWTDSTTAIHDLTREIEAGRIPTQNIWFSKDALSTES